MSQPKYLLENDDIFITSLRIGSVSFEKHDLLTLYMMFQVKNENMCEIEIQKREIAECLSNYREFLQILIQECMC